MLGGRGKKEGAREADTRGDFNVIFHVILGNRLEEAETGEERMGCRREMVKVWW